MYSGHVLPYVSPIFLACRNFIILTFIHIFILCIQYEMFGVILLQLI